MLNAPPVTDASSPVAWFAKPPLTDASGPLAVLNRPPLTDVSCLVALLNAPPPTQDPSLGRVPLAAADGDKGAHRGVVPTAGHRCELAFPGTFVAKQVD